MNRRDLIKNIALVSGGLFVGSNFLLTSCKNDQAGSQKLDQTMLALLSEIAETIIPETDTPGAKSVGVAAFVDKIFQDIYSDEEQKAFLEALNKIETKAKTMGDTFAKLTTDKKAAVFNAVKNKEDKGFLAMYQIILFAYLTSEKGLKATFNYVPIPGKFQGDIPYKKGDKAYVGLQG